MAVQGTFTITIDAPPEKVWPYIADVTRHGDYSPKPFTAELVSGEVGKVGTRYRSVGQVPNDKHHSNEVEVTEAVTNERLVLRSDDEIGPFTNTYVLRPVGNGTEVSWTVAFPPKMKFPLSVLAPVIFPSVGKPDGRKRVQLLKQAVESE